MPYWRFLITHLFSLKNKLNKICSINNNERIVEK